MHTQRAASAMLAGLALAASMVGTATAAPPETLARNVTIDIEFVDDELCPGLEILTRFEGKRTATVYRDAEGNDRRLVIDVAYWGTFTNLADPSLTLSSPGHRHITFDFVRGTYTDVGVYRSVTLRGSGTILLQAGRWLASLEDEAVVYAVSGPHQEWLGDTGAFCAALGG